MDQNPFLLLVSSFIRLFSFHLSTQRLGDPRPLTLRRCVFTGLRFTVSTDNSTSDHYKETLSRSHSTFNNMIIRGTSPLSPPSIPDVLPLIHPLPFSLSLTPFSYSLPERWEREEKRRNKREGKKDGEIVRLWEKSEDVKQGENEFVRCPKQ